MNIPAEAGKAVRNFMTVMKEQPLSLALVVMNFVLLGYLFYSGASLLEQRNATTAMIVKWQQETDRLMASCVSAEVIKMIIDALEKQGKVPDKMDKLILPDVPLPKPNPISKEDRR